MFRIVAEQCVRRLSLAKSSQLKLTHIYRPNILNVSSCHQFTFARNESSGVVGSSSGTISNAETLTTSLETTAASQETITDNVGTISATQQATEPSSESIADLINKMNYIPEPPDPSLPPLEFITPVVEKVIEYAANGDPTLASVGLGNYTPAGFVQHCLHYLHCDLGMPWVAAIVAGTVVVRLLLFPMILSSQRHSANLQNNYPKMQMIQQKMTEARQSGDAYLAAKYGNDLMLFMKEKNLKPFKTMLVPLTMAPIFMSFFFGLRGMANLPLESMKTGGILWFQDLTVCDPYYILPTLACTTLFLTIHIGVDSAKLSTSTAGPMLKYFLRAVPFITFPFLINFPSALLCYWVSANSVSLTQALVLKIPRVREVLKLPTIVNHPKSEAKKSGFVKSAKESWTNIKISKQMEEREQHDDIVFKRAGVAPITKTYKYDPTKVAPPLSAKQRRP